LAASKPNAPLPVVIIFEGFLAALHVRFGRRADADDRHAPSQLGETFLNRVTGPHRDGVAGTPEYKVTAVRVEKAE
jgi:hypothetical protein